MQDFKKIKITTFSMIKAQEILLTNAHGSMYTEYVIRYSLNFKHIQYNDTAKTAI